MEFVFVAHGLESDADLEAFARTTVLFELWRPRCEPTRLTISIAGSDGPAGLLRCLATVEYASGRSYSAGVLGRDAHEVIERVGLALGSLLASRPDSLARAHRMPETATSSWAAPLVQRPDAVEGLRLH